MIPAGAEPVLLHASCVAYAGRAALILGPSGAGKSALALRMIAFGALLVSDDGVRVRSEGGHLLASCPAQTIRGLIEARGVGILRAPTAPETPLALAVDLEQVETERLPPLRRYSLLGHALPLVLRPQNDHLAESLLLYLTGGRHQPEP